MENSKIKEKLLSSNKNSRLEKLGKSLTFLCIALIVFVVGA
ncbi:MAG: phosphate ABC transporter permease subunit PstC, partial [Lactococcus lactis]|nr:phosphate ABC transporter permease subunit PstC [Lactococcus lactis]